MSIPTEPDPRPKLIPDPPAGIVWPVRARWRCPPVTPPPEASFAAVLEARRSERAIRPARLREVVNALAFATRPRFVRDGDAHSRTRRPSLSAGALHAIELVIMDWRGSPRLMRYDAMAHRLELLRSARPSSLLQFARTCAAILPEAPATALALIGDQRRVATVYDHPVSLLWRDAGALLQTLGLISTAYRLAFCPLGVLGGEIVDAMEIDRRAAQPVGCAMIGRRPLGEEADE